jgi:hypothetical protein
MPGKRILFASALLVSAAFGQTKSQTFSFTQADAAAIKEFAFAIKNATEARDVTSDEAGRSLMVQGTPEQLAIATWLTGEFNHPPSARAATIRHEYPNAIGDNQVLQVFFLAHLDSPQDLQEAINTTRSVGDIQRMAHSVTVKAIIGRGDRSDLETAEWILGQVDQAADALKPGGRNRTIKVSDTRRQDTAAQVYVLSNTKTPQAMQELINGVRSVAEIQRFFPFHSHNLVIIRASTEQLALADWMIQLLDEPAGDTATHEFHYTPAYAHDTATIARVFFLNHVDSALRLMQIVDEVRTATQIQRMFPNNQLHAILMRGSGDQVSRAEQMIKERDQ